MAPTTDDQRPMTVYDVANLVFVRDDRSRTQPHAGAGGALRFVAGGPARARQISLGKLGDFERERTLLHALGNQLGGGDRRVLQAIFFDQVAGCRLSGVSRFAQFLREEFRPGFARIEC